MRNATISSSVNLDGGGEMNDAELLRLLNILVDDMYVAKKRANRNEVIARPLVQPHCPPHHHASLIQRAGRSLVAAHADCIFTGTIQTRAYSVYRFTCDVRIKQWESW